MDDQKKKANIEKMAELLRKRATMLNLSCPKCENILFRMQNGKIFCPSCNKEVIIQKENELPIKQQSIEKTRYKTEVNLSFNNFSDEIKILRQKISMVCLNLREIEQDNVIKTKLDILEHLVKIYKLLLEIETT